MNLSTPVSAISFIGPVYAKRLEKLGIVTAGDFLHHYPRRYADFSLISAVGSLQIGETATIQGNLLSITSSRTRSRLTIQKAVVSDGTGTIDCTWFNQPFLEQSLKPGVALSISGLVTSFRGKPVLESPEHELLTNNQQPTTNRQLPNTIHTGRLIPLYPETYGVSSKWLRSRIVYILKNIDAFEEDYLPTDVRSMFKLLPLDEAIRHIHFPNSSENAQRARSRLAFDEVLFSQLASLIRKNEWRSETTSYQLKKVEHFVSDFVSKLPFALTSAQKRVLGEIMHDLKINKPMNRLVQGDVGSGKTVVAAAAMYAMHKSGFSSVIMAPTEILAQQHYKTISALFEPLGLPVALVTSSSKMRKGHEPITIGTHALLFKQEFDTLGLVVIDEQHRFGVEQRSALRELGVHPHLLSMTATPIPRSIALVLYSELDLSVIDEMPVGRIPVKTWLVPNEKRKKAYDWIKEQLGDNVAAGPWPANSHARQGRATTNNQAFIVCPLIDESESETMATVKAVTKEFEMLKKEFSSMKLGLVHGRLKSKEKKEVLDEFGNGEIDILVATPVVEVGIDIPNATIMMIEAAERFGLAQLHQLRGRVGRGKKQSYCLLFTESDNERTRARLKSLERLSTGNALAELDLKLRGPGDLFGRMQSGYVNFKLADFSDRTLIAAAQKAAHHILNHNLLKKHELLQKKLESYTIHRISPN